MAMVLMALVGRIGATLLVLIPSQMVLTPHFALPRSANTSKMKMKMRAAEGVE